MKRLLFWICFFLFLKGDAQTDIVRLSKIKDFINAGLTYALLSNDSIRRNTGDANWSEIDTAFEKNTVESPFYFAAMQQFLQGRFDTVTRNFSATVDLIDVKQYEHLDEQTASHSLFDTAALILQRLFPFVFPAGSKDSLYQTLFMSTSAQTAPAPLSIDSIQEPILTTTPAKEEVPWYGNLGILSLFLTGLLIFAAFYFFYQIRRLKQELQAKIIAAETNEEKAKEASEEKSEEVAHQHPVSAVYTEFKDLVSVKIKDIYDSIEHLNLRIASLEKEPQLLSSLNVEAPVIDEPGKHEIEDSIHEIDDSINNEEVFYMAAPLPGHFPFSSRSLKKDALYKFVLNGTNKEAHYEVINDGFPIGGALHDTSKYFEHACVAEAEPQDEVRVIITKEPGIAALDDGKWIIKKKAAIIFI